MTSLPQAHCKIAVVIPCYRVTSHVLGVIAAIGPEVTSIYAVDDGCPDGSGDFIARECHDPRVRVLRNAVNLGVGGAVMNGYRAAAAESHDCIIKIDGDGQMNPELIGTFAAPILAGTADYTKGNRFYQIEGISNMPKVRVFGNAVLSFINKFSSGYWDLFDPTNGYTAISGQLATVLPYAKLNPRYFFESDLLFRIGLLHAVVQDIPMEAVYGDEVSGLKISRILPRFIVGHLVNFAKRIFYDYFLRDFSIATVELVLGTLLLLFGVIFGTVAWVTSIESGQVATAGTVMLSGLPVMVGIQSLLSFLNYDIHVRTGQPISSRLPRARSQKAGAPLRSTVP